MRRPGKLKQFICIISMFGATWIALYRSGRSQENDRQGEYPTESGSVWITDEPETQAILVAQETQPPARQQEGVIEQPSTRVEAPAAPSSSLLSRLGDISPERAAQLGGGTASNVVSGAEVTVLGTTDTGDLLANSVFNTGVYSRRISPVITNTRVRGYRYSQISTTLDGAAWFPVRPDADTPLSRFDSNIVKDVVIIRGPYDVRLGPGFSFIDVALENTPRFCCFQLEGESMFSWDTNGEQFYGRQSFQGGNSTSGWRIGYGHRGGIDFNAGDSLPLASSYKTRDWNFAYGFDLSDCSSIEFTFIRTDMTDVDTPGQVNDFRFLISDGFSLRYVLEDQVQFDRFSVQGWYNRSDFQGKLDNKTVDPADNEFFLPPADPAFPARFARVTTYGNTSSAGLRTMISWGDTESQLLSIGADFNVLRQTYLERREATGVEDFGVPQGRAEDGGLFADDRMVVNDKLTMKAGARIDFVETDSIPTATVDARSLALNSNVPLPQSFTLLAGYISGDYKVREGITMNGGVGYAERAPSLTDLYGDLPHLSIMQEGAFFVPHGELLLKKEQALQADLGVTLEVESFQGGLSFFYAHVGDFITYDAPHLPPPSGAHEQHAIGVNRDARFVGGEFFGELQLLNPLSLFGTISHVQGTDLDLGEPMWGVAPLDARIGLRFIDPAEQRWGVEYILRMVAEQNRLSTVGFIGELTTPSFQTHDVRGYYQVSEGASLVLGVENIGDTFYREHLDTRLDLTSGANTARGIVRRGISFYFALQGEY